MRTIGAYEAKTHLPRLLDAVSAGESITITKHGVPVARLVPPTDGSQSNAGEVIDALKRYRETIKPLGDITARDLIEHGRKY